MNQLDMIKTLGSEQPILGGESKKILVVYGDTKRHFLTLGKSGFEFNPKIACWIHRNPTPEIMAGVKNLRGLKRITLYVPVRGQMAMRLPYAPEHSA